MWGTRLGKTTIIENIFGYSIDQDPYPMMSIHENERKAKNWSKITFQPLIDACPALREKVADVKTRSSDNEILMKTFPLGYWVGGGANTPSTFRGYNARLVAFDEVDGYPASAGQEGDPIDLGRKRAANYLNRKYIYTSTPTIRGASRIEELWKKSDQRHYFVACPLCGEKQMLIFGPHSQYAKYANGYLRYEAERGEIVHAEYVCSFCKQAIAEKHKMWMLMNAEWRKMQPWVKHHAGFQLSSLYSPWVTWREIAKEFHGSEKRAERLLVMVTTLLAETFADDVNHEWDENEFLARREPYEKIPAGVVLLTVGVDVQDDRLEVVIYGWGEEEECWFIERGIIKGSPEEDLTWEMLDQFILKQRVHENGFPAEYGKLGGILAVCVDTGDGEHSNTVNAYVAHRKRHRFFAIKGANKPQKDFVIATRTKKKRNFLILVDTFQGKKKIYYRLNVKQAVDAEGRKIPTPQMMHFNMSCDKDFFEQLTSEQIKLKKVRGFNRQVWELPSGKRNEVLDCTDYALAGLHAIVPGGTKNIDPFLKRLSNSLQFKMQQWEESHPEQSASGGASKDDQQISPSSRGQGEETPPPQSPLTTRPPRKRLRMKLK